MEQMQKLMEFSGSDNFGFLSPPQVEAFKGYLVQLRQRLAQEAQQQAQMAAAAQAQSGGAAQAVPGPQGTAPINAGNPQLQKNELLDESLPSAGGGGNPATLQ